MGTAPSVTTAENSPFTICSIVLSTTEWVGGKNDFLGVAYVVVGVICLVLAVGFTVKDRCSPRKAGDAGYIRQKGANK